MNYRLLYTVLLLLGFQIALCADKGEPMDASSLENNTSLENKFGSALDGIPAGAILDGDTVKLAKSGGTFIGQTLGSAVKFDGSSLTSRGADTLLIRARLEQFFDGSNPQYSIKFYKEGIAKDSINVRGGRYPDAKIKIAQDYDSISYTIIDDGGASYLNIRRLYLQGNNTEIILNASSNQFITDEAVSIYPNPVTYGNINVELPSKYSSDQSYNIMDQNGRILKTGELRSDVSVSELDNGIYFINISTTKGVLVNRFVVAQ